MKRKWSKVERGDVVELGGREWTIVAVKLKKGGRVKVAVRSGTRTAESVVDADAKVRIVQPPSELKPAAAARAVGDPWERPIDRVERKLDEILGARLIGQSDDGEKSWYVPLVDEQTVSSHLVIFHGGIPDEARGDVERMVALHAGVHVDAGTDTLTGVVPHIHTDRRPKEKTR